MKHTPIALIALALLCATPSASAFFNELDGLKAMIATANVEPDEGIEDLLTQLDTEDTGAFEDVKRSEWYYPFVASVVDWGIVSGYRAADGQLTGKYGPADSVTVGQMLKMSIKAAQVDEAGCKPTLDHPKAAGHWAEIYVRCAETLQMRAMRDYPDLDRPVLRAEVISIIHDAFRISVPQVYSNFKDTMNHRYEADIAYANITGLVTGDSDANGNPLGTFRPDAPLNRAEAARIVYQALRVYAEEVAASAQEEQRITMVAKPGSFSPSIITVKRGVPLTITFVNSGMHSLVIEELGVRQDLTEFQQTLTITPGKIGTFPFYSDIPGDRESGMIGTMIVH